jgi:hypothetical protein
MHVSPQVASVVSVNPLSTASGKTSSPNELSLTFEPEKSKGAEIKVPLDEETPDFAVVFCQKYDTSYMNALSTLYLERETIKSMELRH